MNFLLDLAEVDELDLEDFLEVDLDSASTEDKIKAALTFFEDVTDGSTNIVYINIGGNVLFDAVEDYGLYPDLLDGVDLNSVTARQLIKTIKENEGFED